MDIGKSFSYVFEDPNWVKKVLIGGVINLIPIVNFAATGYGVEELKRTYDGSELPLPEWDSFGGYFVKGLMTFVAGFIYSLPALLIYCCVLFVLPAVGLGGSSTSGRGSSGGGQLEGLAGIAFACAACLIVLYAIVVLFMFPALLARYAITGQFGTFFQFGPAWQLIQTNTGGYVLAVVVWILANLIAGLVGGIACGLGAAWTGFWASLVGASLFGNFARGGAVAQPAPVPM